MKLSSRLNGLEESITLAITAKANALRASGKNVIGLGAGEPDFDTPENIKEAAIKAIRDGKTKYTPVSGIAELKDAIIAKFKRDNNLAYTREQVLVSSGGKHSIFNLFQAIINPGDEVVIPAPYWVSYPAMVMLAGGRPVIVKTDEGAGFKMKPEEFAAAITPQTKAVVINSPSNPTGAAYTASELKDIASVALDKGVLIISDEIYEMLAYDGFKPVSIASTSDKAARNTVVLNGVSKAYAMTGWRIGYAAGPPAIIQAMTNIQSQSTSNPASISQWAAVEALNGTQGFIPMMVKEFASRRDAMVTGLNAINGISAKTPLGAFYVFANVSGVYGRGLPGMRLTDSSDLAVWLLDEAGVALVPGAPFGDDNYIRLSYATSMDNINEGIRRMGEALARLK
ncbi:MAG: pyridoxal phosphate-dependent aminotransferase [Deltaproteobacteria bacterium]|nr:pyridoxal phosphate-dependent aminotransferase [Deltaproteobacteria bacterium]